MANQYDDSDEILVVWERSSNGGPVAQVTIKDGATLRALLDSPGQIKLAVWKRKPSANPQAPLYKVKIDRWEPNGGGSRSGGGGGQRREPAPDPGPSGAEYGPPEDESSIPF